MLCMQNLAMRMHCTVPSCTQHDIWEPQCCSGTEGMQKLGNANALSCTCRHMAQLLGAIMLCIVLKACKLGNANALHRARRHTARFKEL